MQLVYFIKKCVIIYYDYFLCDLKFVLFTKLYKFIHNIDNCFYNNNINFRFIFIQILPQKTPNDKSDKLKNT